MPSRFASIFPIDAILPIRLHQDLEAKISDAAGPIKKVEEEQQSYQFETDAALFSERKTLQDLNLSVERLDLSTKTIVQ